MDSNDVPVPAPFVRMQVDRITGETMLLGPEVALQLTEQGAEILGLCDGVRTLGDIASRLASDYDAPVAEILLDAREFLARLADRGYVRTEAD